MMDEDFEPEDPSFQNIIEQKSLKWIFVGGKGGVGKTTTSCSLAALLSKTREKVLIISTDPAHNLSDAFGQKFSKSPTLVKGFDNLFAMEVDPKVEFDSGDALNEDQANMFMEIIMSLPGADEAVSFAELMKLVQTMDYSTVIFDTAPTGHTLKLLSIPTTLEKGLDNVIALKSKFGGMFSQMTDMLRSQANSNLPPNTEEKVKNKIEEIKETVAQVNKQFKDVNLTTFVCVAIPEFLSLFETERLIQELSKNGMDSCNIVVNQVLFPDEGSNCRKCLARVKMQKKYLLQIFDLYDDFHITLMPLLDEEVRGIEGLKAFGALASDIDSQRQYQEKAKNQ